MEADVEDCADHVKVEAVDLDVQPGHERAPRWFQVADAIMARHLMVVYLHLHIEDGRLVHEDRHSIKYAANQLVYAISVSSLHIFHLDLLSGRLFVNLRHRDITVDVHPGRDHGDGEKCEMGPS